MALVAGKTSREVAAHVAVGHLLRAVHQYLRTIVKLRNAVDGEQQGESLFQFQSVLTLSEESVSVVVLDECHHV